MTMKRLTVALILVCLLAVRVSVEAQTRISLRSQSKDVDFSAADYTRPLKTGVIPPATCVVGDLFFDTDAPPGENIFGCTSPNVWAPVGAQRGTALPGGCEVGELYFKTDAPQGLNLFGCTTLNTWTVLGDGIGTTVGQGTTLPA